MIICVVVPAPVLLVTSKSQARMWSDGQTKHEAGTDRPTVRFKNYNSPTKTLPVPLHVAPNEMTARYRPRKILFLLWSYLLRGTKLLLVPKAVEQSSH